jgi:hypothetical protein
MAEDEDSARDGLAEEVERNTAFDPEGAYCRLINHRRPAPGISHLVMPPKAKKELALARRKLDAAFWLHAAEKLKAAAVTGNISRSLAAQLATAIHRGCAGFVPASWRRQELVEYTPGGAALYLGDQRMMAAMYRLAVEKKQITDPHPAQTIVLRCGVDDRTWNRWSGWFNSNRDLVANELGMLLLEAPFLLEDAQEFRCALLVGGDPDTEEAGMSGRHVRD